MNQGRNNTKHQRDIKDENRFNLFSLIEDNINGVICFFIKFFKTAVHFSLRPRKVIKDFIGVNLPDYDLWPRPYTYLAISFFIFFQVNECLISPWEIFGELKTKGFLDVPKLTREISELSIKSFLLFSFPATALAILIGFFLTKLSGPMEYATQRKFTHVTAYAYGTQFLILALFISSINQSYYFIMTKPSHSLYNYFILIGVLIFAYSLVLPLLTLSKWYSETPSIYNIMKNKWTRSIILLMVSLFSILAVFIISGSISERHETNVTTILAGSDYRMQEDKVNLTMRILFNNNSAIRYIINNDGSFECVVSSRADSDEDDKIISFVPYHIPVQNGYNYKRIEPHEMTLITVIGTINRADFKPKTEFIRKVDTSFHAIAFLSNGEVKRKVLHSEFNDIDISLWYRR